jgi:two-component system response regulator NreC
MLARMTDDATDTGEVTVVLADDHAVVRKGLRLLVDAEPGLRVVAEAGTVPDALRMARAHRPAVIVLDLNMPGGSSLEAIPTILEEAPTTAISCRHRRRCPATS